MYLAAGHSVSLSLARQGLSLAAHRQLKATRYVRPAGLAGPKKSAAPRLTPGTVLLKTWQGQRYTVTVAAEGYEFQGQTYASLSEIARRITGTRWNGPAFFGLRRRTPNPSPNPVPKPKGRP